MVDSLDLTLPDISEADVTWACRVLGLPAHAFHGAHGQDPRLPVLKSLATTDVEACPGSGKTTLLVAKLAILANSWIDQRRGLCVLSHTNVARKEIERKLGNMAAGQRLLRYPHFIGTIHGFVNEFLALPWLRSKGYPVEMIDDDIAQKKRMRMLPRSIRSRLETEHRTVQLRIQSPEFSVGTIPWGKGTLGSDKESYRKIQEVCRVSVAEGYFCHDEMFVWAQDLLNETPETASFIRHRFPLLFLDEVQDNSEHQAKLLHRIFMAGDAPIVRQRYGDSNQAIYQQPGEAETLETDIFPIENIRKVIPNSFRFSKDIATLADPLAVVPQGLVGMGGGSGSEGADLSGKHTIFLFDDNSITHVLSSYAGYLSDLFSDVELRSGTFTAVAAVHRPGENNKIPRTVAHYWQPYDSEIGGSDPQPRSFVQYVRAGQRLSRAAGETHQAVEKVAAALLRLARLSSADFKTGTRKYKHRQLLRLVEDNEEALRAYNELVVSLAIEQEDLSKADWNENWRATSKEVVKGITGSDVSSPEAEKFLDWEEPIYTVGGLNTAIVEPCDNIFRHPKDDPKIAIRVGSIHSVKGETHTATLVLESFYRTHHLKALKDWLLGAKTGGVDATATLQSRMRQHYVAMTRPSRLLCLAMREDSFKETDFAKLKARGWRLARVSREGANWLE